MKIQIATLVLVILQLNLFGQDIDYTIPGIFENDIKRKDYKIIVDESVRVVAGRYEVIAVKEGTIILGEGQEMGAFNLDNLVLKCMNTPGKENWPKVIQSHYNGIFESLDARKDIYWDDFENVKPRLAVRLYEEDFVIRNGGSDYFVIKKELEGTRSILMLDLPSAFTPVSKDVFESWELPVDEVFTIARNNIDPNSVEMVSEEVDAGGINIVVSFLEGENYASSIALDLHRNFPGLVGDWGSVVAIPNKGLVAICKVSEEKPLDFVKFIQEFKQSIEKAYNEHPRPISRDFFWYYKGKFTKINVIQEGGDIDVISPIGLTDLLTGEGR